MVHIRTLLDKMNEIHEGRMKDIFTANQEGKSAKEIAKALKLPLSTVKSILGEGKEEIKEVNKMRTQKTLHNVKKYHTTSSQVGKVAYIAQCKKLVLTHFVPTRFNTSKLKKNLDLR